MEWLINFVQNMPLLSVIILSLALTSIYSLIHKKFTNQQRMKEIKERQKELQKIIKEEKDQNKLLEVNREMIKLSGEMLKMSFKSTIIILLSWVIIIFPLLNSLYDAAGVGNIIYWGTNLPIIGDGAGWLLSYFIFTFVFSIIINKYIFKTF